MSERKPGWYWCVMDGALFPIYYSGGMWWKGGHKLWEEPRIVSGRIPTPEERWQAVPVEPTYDMMQAGYWSGSGDVSINEEWARREVWKRMLAAAPKPEDS